MKKVFLKLCFVILCLLAVVSCEKEKTKKELTMGLVPVSNAEKLIEDVDPLYKLLSQKTDKEVKGFIATNYIGVVEALGSGSVDFALIPPFAYLLANKKHGSEALLTSINKDGAPGYYSIILARSDKNINTVEDLKGKKIAFVDPSSTSGYIFPAVILNDHNIDLEKDIQYQFAGGHDKALQLLLNGDVDAIGTYESIFRKFSKEFPDMNTKTKVLEKSDLIPGVTLTVSSKLDNDTKEKIKKAFLEVTTEKESENLLYDLFGIKGFQEADINNYKTVETKLERMGIDLEKIK